MIMKLGDVCTFDRGLTYSKADEVANSSNGVLRSNNIDLVSNTLCLDEIKYIREDIDIPESKKTKKGSILICMANGSKCHLGKVAIIDIEEVFAFGGFMGLITPTETISSKYLYYSLITPKYKKLIASLSDGANINNLKFRDIQDFEIPVPSLSEQERIVKILDAAFEKIDRLKENAEEGLQAVKDLWEARLSNLFEAKDGWTNSNLGSLVDFKNGVNFTPSENGTKIKFLGVGDFKDRVTITASDLDYISTNQTIDNEYHLQKDDIIIVRSNGSKTLVGRTVIFNENIDEPLIYSGFCIRCRIKDKSLLLPAFLNILFRTTKVKRHLTYGDNGCNISNINQKKLSSLQISYPSLEDQKKIVEEYEIISSLCKRLTFNYEKELAEYEALKQSILRKAFSGEL